MVHWLRLRASRSRLACQHSLGRVQRGLKSGNRFISAVATRSEGPSRQDTWGQGQENLPWSPEHKEPLRAGGIGCHHPQSGLEALRRMRECQKMQGTWNCGRAGRGHRCCRGCCSGGLGMVGGLLGVHLWGPSSHKFQTRVPGQYSKTGNKEKQCKD